MGCSQRDEKGRGHFEGCAMSEGPGEPISRDRFDPLHGLLYTVKPLLADWARVQDRAAEGIFAVMNAVIWELEG